MSPKQAAPALEQVLQSVQIAAVDHAARQVTLRWTDAAGPHEELVAGLFNQPVYGPAGLVGVDNSDEAIHAAVYRFVCARAEHAAAPAPQPVPAAPPAGRPTLLGPLRLDEVDDLTGRPLRELRQPPPRGMA